MSPEWEWIGIAFKGAVRAKRAISNDQPTEVTRSIRSVLMALDLFIKVAMKAEHLSPAVWGVLTDMADGWLDLGYPYEAHDLAVIGIMRRPQEGPVRDHLWEILNKAKIELEQGST